MHWQNEHQPGVTYTGSYHSRHGANHEDWGQYRSNLGNESPPPQSAVSYHITLLYLVCSTC